MTIETTLTQEFYARPSIEVAKDLIGKKIVTKHAKGIITEVAAWEGETESKHPGLLYAPGVVGISKRFGKYITLVGTDREGVASGITLLGTQIGSERVTGPGKFSDALGISDLAEGVRVYESDLIRIIDGIRQGALLQRTAKMPENCKGVFYLG